MYVCIYVCMYVSIYVSLIVLFVSLCIDTLKFQVNFKKKIIELAGNEISPLIFVLFTVKRTVQLQYESKQKVSGDDP